MKDFEQLLSKFSSLPEYVIEIGVITANNKRKTVKAQIGLTNAEIMFINENGSPLRHIPARPVLQMTIDWANKNLLNDTISKAVDAFISSNFDERAVEREIEKMCVRMENYARDLIYSNDGRLAPNAPSTIKRKGDNHPLFDTGQLARSISCRLIKS